MDLRVAVITGANKGLGLALARALSRHWGAGGKVVITARDPERGRQALADLAAEGLEAQCLPLDLADDGSIQALAARVRAEHGGVDVLIQNGAYAAVPDRPGRDQVRLMVRTNNLGTHRLLRAFRPLLRTRARVLVVASGFGTLQSLEPRLHDRFDTDRLSLDQLEANLEAYVRAVEEDQAGAEGWPEWINIPSKVGQVAAARIFARELAADPAAPAGLLVNAVCPGWMITDASRPYLDSLPAHIQPRLPDQAAPDVLWAALLPPGAADPQGELLQYRKIIPWKG